MVGCGALEPKPGHDDDEYDNQLDHEAGGGLGWLVRGTDENRGKVMSHGANKLQMPYLTFSIYSSCPISGKSINSCKNQINSCKNQINSCRHYNLCPMTFC